MRRQYQRHTDNCGGIDPVVVERIIHAGTVEVFPPEHVICDCERAYIAANVDKAWVILKTNAHMMRKLVNLWHTIETSQPKDEDEDIELIGGSVRGAAHTQ